jgi:hypothetical protein
MFTSNASQLIILILNISLWQGLGYFFVFDPNININMLI